MAFCDGSVPRRPMPPVAYGLSSGTAAFPSKALMIGAPSVSASYSNSCVACKAPCPTRIAIFFPRFRMSAACSNSTRAGT